MKKLLASIAVVGVLMSGVAKAADVALSPAPAGAFDWSGPYIGINGGFGFGQNFRAERGVGASSTPASISGILGGVTAGYNFQASSNFVFGIEGDYALSNLQADSLTSASFSCTGGDCKFNDDWLGTARARAGIAIGNKALLFATGGLAVGGVRDYSSASGASASMIGYAVGGGIETPLTDHLTAKIEALYVNLGRLEIPAPCSVQCYTDVNFGVARVGLNYKF